MEQDLDTRLEPNDPVEHDELGFGVVKVTKHSNSELSSVTVAFGNETYTLDPDTVVVV